MIKSIINTHCLFQASEKQITKGKEKNNAQNQDNNPLKIDLKLKWIENLAQNVNEQSSLSINEYIIFSAEDIIKICTNKTIKEDLSTFLDFFKTIPAIENKTKAAETCRNLIIFIDLLTGEVNKKIKVILKDMLEYFLSTLSEIIKDISKEIDETIKLKKIKLLLNIPLINSNRSVTNYYFNLNILNIDLFFGIIKLELSANKNMIATKQELLQEINELNQNENANFNKEIAKELGLANIPLLEFYYAYKHLISQFENVDNIGSIPFMKDKDSLSYDKQYYLDMKEFLNTLEKKLDSEKHFKSITELFQIMPNIYENPALFHEAFFAMLLFLKIKKNKENHRIQTSLSLFVSRWLKLIEKQHEFDVKIDYNRIYGLLSNKSVVYLFKNTLHTEQIDLSAVTKIFTEEVVSENINSLRDTFNTTDSLILKNKSYNILKSAPVFFQYAIKLLKEAKTNEELHKLSFTEFKLPMPIILIKIMTKKSLNVNLVCDNYLQKILSDQNDNSEEDNKEITQQLKKSDKVEKNKLLELQKEEKITEKKEQEIENDKVNEEEKN